MAPGRHGGGPSKLQVLARNVHWATGAGYTSCLNHLRSFHGDQKAREAYLDQVAAIPQERRGTAEHPLCVRCLGQHGGRCA